MATLTMRIDTTTVIIKSAIIVRAATVEIVGMVTVTIALAEIAGEIVITITTNDRRQCPL